MNTHGSLTESSWSVLYSPRAPADRIGSGIKERISTTKPLLDLATCGRGCGLSTGAGS
jgi:hypothetical protein